MSSSWRNHLEQHRSCREAKFQSQNLVNYLFHRHSSFSYLCPFLSSWYHLRGRPGGTPPNNSDQHCLVFIGSSGTDFQRVDESTVRNEIPRHSHSPNYVHSYYDSTLPLYLLFDNPLALPQVQRRCSWFSPQLNQLSGDQLHHCPGHPLWLRSDVLLLEQKERTHLKLGQAHWLSEDSSWKDAVSSFPHWIQADHSVQDMVFHYFFRLSRTLSPILHFDSSDFSLCQRQDESL